MPTRTATDRAIASSYFQRCLDQTLDSLVQATGHGRKERRKYRQLREALIGFSRQAAGLAMVYPPSMLRAGDIIPHDSIWWDEVTADALYEAGLEELIQRTWSTLLKRFPQQLFTARHKPAEWIHLENMAINAGGVARLILAGASPEEIYPLPAVA